MDNKHPLRQRTSRGLGRHVLVSGSKAADAYTITLNLEQPTVDQLHKYLLGYRASALGSRHLYRRVL